MARSLEINGKKVIYGFTFHHIALRRGYVGVNDEYYESYNGKFGRGIIHHMTTKASGCSNSYHYVAYYIGYE